MPAELGRLDPLRQDRSASQVLWEQIQDGGRQIFCRELRVPSFPDRAFDYAVS